MCRIASLFLLRRLKGSTSGDARDFNNLETRALTNDFFPLCKAWRTMKFTPFLQKYWGNMHHCAYDPETKQQSVEWRNSGSPRPNKFRVQKSAGKVLASIFWDQDNILLSDYLRNGHTINAEYYSFLLVQLKDIFKERKPREGQQWGLVLARQCPGSPGTCNPEETGLPGLPVS